MIEFEKIIGVPFDVDPGEERVWYSSAGLTYVADNQGHPIRVSAGFQEGDAVPVGKPAASGILYYCVSNGRYYLSSKTDWIVLNTEPKAGGSSSEGYAGGVFLTDLGNYFTSNEVEGALQEIGAAMPHIFGAKTLLDLSGTLQGFNIAGERKVNANTASSPTTSSSWLNQRQDRQGNIYGLMVSSTGQAFTRAGNTFVELAGKTELNEVLSNVETSIGDAVRNVENYSVRAGNGILISSDGKISSSPQISIDTNVITRLINNAEASKPVESPPVLNYLPLTGGTATGDIQISKTNPQLILRNGLSSHRYAIGGTGSAGAFYIKDMSNGLDLIRYDAMSKKLKLSNYEQANGIQALGPFQVANTTNPREPNGPNASLFTLYVDGSNGNHAIFRGANGATLIREDLSSNLIQSTNSAYTASRNMYIGGFRGASIEEFKVSADEAKFTKNLTISNTLNVGMDHFGPYGLINTNNKIMVYPRTKKSSMEHAMARRFVAQMSYDQNNDTFEFKGYKTSSNSAWTEAPLNVSAIKFVNRSSEKFKENIEEFNESGLELVDKIKAYTYNFKINDDKEKKDLGFIIERGVPEIAIEEDGNSIDSYAMVGILWKAVQELSDKVKKLEAK